MFKTCTKEKKAGAAPGLFSAYLFSGLLCPGLELSDDGLYLVVIEGLLGHGNGELLVLLFSARASVLYDLGYVRLRGVLNKRVALEGRGHRRAGPVLSVACRALRLEDGRAIRREGGRAEREHCRKSQSQTQESFHFSSSCSVVLRALPAAKRRQAAGPHASSPDP